MVKSPCINICVSDDNGSCTGCYRTMREISRWPSFSDEEKNIILEKCKLRKQEKEDAQRKENS